MKIKPKQYARALHDSLKDADKVSATATIEKFAQILIKNNQVSQMEKVFDYFVEMWDREKGIIKVEISQARELDKTTETALNKYITNIADAKSIEITHRIDEKLIGGVVIKYNDRIIDKSLRNRINEFKKIIE